MQKTVTSLQPLSTTNSGTPMPVLKKDVIKSLTFLLLPERHQSTLDEFHVLMQRFPRVITNMNALELEFLEYQATPDDEFQFILAMVISDAH